VNSPPGHAPAKGEQASPGPSALAPPHTSQPPAVGLPPSSGEILRYRLSKECTVDVAFSGPITQSAIDKLRAYLDLSKDAYPETE